MSNKTFARFDCLAFDLATARHNWNEHKLKLVLSADAPKASAESVTGVHSMALAHKMTRTGRAVSIAIDTVIVRAAGQTIGPFSAASIVNATTGAPLAYADLGKAITLEDGSSTEFKFPPDVLFVTA